MIRGEFSRITSARKTKHCPDNLRITSDTENLEGSLCAISHLHVGILYSNFEPYSMRVPLVMTPHNTPVHITYHTHIHTVHTCTYIQEVQIVPYKDHKSKKFSSISRGDISGSTTFPAMP